jgi:hypothetical protein
MTCFICEETLTRSKGYVHGMCAECAKAKLLAEHIDA